MDKAYRDHRRHASRPPRLRPALFVTLDPLRIHVSAADALELDRLRPIAALVEHVLAHALQRGAGAA